MFALGAWAQIAVGHRTFYYRAVQLWNDLCPELNLSMTIKDFKRKLNQMLTFKVLVQDCLIFADQLILRPTKRLKYLFDASFSVHTLVLSAYYPARASVRFTTCHPHSLKNMMAHLGSQLQPTDAITGLIYTQYYFIFLGQVAFYKCCHAADRPRTTPHMLVLHYSSILKIVSATKVPT